MSGLNKCQLIGRLGADPEVKQITNGKTVARLSVATTEQWGVGDSKSEKTEWHKVVVWGKLAELCGKYLVKGRQVYVEGRLQSRSWEDNQGQKKYTTEVIAQTVQFLGGKEHHDAGAPSSSATENFGDTPSFDHEETIPF